MLVGGVRRREERLYLLRLRRYERRRRRIFMAQMFRLSEIGLVTKSRVNYTCIMGCKEGCKDHRNVRVTPVLQPQ